ncbi:hypothetical protein [Mycobacterium lehmannii]|uniref:hypothetical protein n=1 Tax=Mycobacterium lehmannii TaxID=2048550 RepID=UPI001E31A2C9|nr:hypothetical protein [Mycobacterium lehmannii]
MGSAVGVDIGFGASAVGVAAFSSSVSSSALLREDPVLVWALTVTPPVTVRVRVVESDASSSLSSSLSTLSSLSVPAEVEVDVEVDPAVDVDPVVEAVAPLPDVADPVAVPVPPLAPVALLADSDLEELSDGESVVSATA